MYCICIILCCSWTNSCNALWEKCRKYSFLCLYSKLGNIFFGINKDGNGISGILIFKQQTKALHRNIWSWFMMSPGLKKFIIKYGDIYLFSKLAFWQQKLIVGRYSQIKQVKKCAKQFFISKHSEKDAIFFTKICHQKQEFYLFYKGKSRVYNLQLHRYKNKQ